MGAGERRRGGFGNRSRFGGRNRIGGGRRRFGFGRFGGRRRAVGRIQLKNKNMKIGCCLLFGSMCCCMPGLPLLIMGTVVLTGSSYSALLIAGAVLLGIGFIVLLVGAILCGVGSGQPADAIEPEEGETGQTGPDGQPVPTTTAASATTVTTHGPAAQPVNGTAVNPGAAPPSYNATVYGQAPGQMAPPPPPGALGYDQPSNYPPAPTVQQA